MKVLIAIFVILGSAFAAPSVRITNGQDAERNQFPYQVSMQWGFFGIWQHLCGGVILTETWILTAGHCITEAPAIGNFRIRAGLLLLNEADSNIIQTVGVSTNIVHEDYLGGVNPNDIALLRLSSSLTWNEGVQAIALPQAGSVPTGESVISGWGSISTTIIPSMPNHLQMATIPLVPLDQCANALIEIVRPTEPLPLADTNVCTGPLDNSRISACGGDSGGPLTQNGEIIGIVSWGVTPCGAIGAPSVYVRVSAYIDWINARIS